MNALFHFLLNYLVINNVFRNAFDYIIYILIFSTVIDLDHIPYIIKSKKYLLHNSGSECRSRFHEIYGMCLFTIGISVVSIFFDLIIIKIIAMSLILHYAVDFLLGKTKPLYPFFKKEVFLNILLQKHRIWFELMSTLILGLIWVSIIT